MKGELETINVGIVGHIDHGKTTLLQKLSGKWADTHSQELKRGITLKLGYADITLYKDKDTYNREKGEPVLHVSFIDSPGHEMLMATMLSGAAIIDAAILVVAANEGIKPQTREHLIALQAKKVKNLIVVQNKIDLISAEQAKANYKEIKELLKNRYENVTIIPVSAQQEINLDEIYRAIAELPLPKRDNSKDPIFIIARSFDINKPGTVPKEMNGTVLGGTLKQGCLKIGDEIEIKPGRVIKEANQYHYKTVKAKIVNLFKGSRRVALLTPGGSMSIETSLDPAIGKSDALAGCICSLPGILPEITTTIKIKFALFPEVFGTGTQMKVDPIKASEMLMLSVNTSMTVGIVKKIKNDEIELSLKIPIVPQKGENLGIARNINNHWRLIGYGEII
ncbi:MAG: translation initiation factor IF-2 subunit gamma [Nanoarchaeota archaeon]|nr:translation initiation factor IF-2 subunit gamma [Nanoarchaeota archaeon]